MTMVCGKVSLRTQKSINTSLPVYLEDDTRLVSHVDGLEEPADAMASVT